MVNMEFGEDYYEQVMREHNYDPVDFSFIDFNLEDMGAEDLNRKFVCHFNGDKFAENLDQDSIVTTGFGLSGEPHIGTISQIMHAINLQDAGLDVQIVLGDLDSYNARGMDLKEVRELVPKYENFITELGFDTDQGILRNQEDRHDVLHTSYLIANHLEDEDFLETEEDLSELYQEEGVYDGIGFPVKQSILLMTGDFLNLGMKEDYDNVLVSLGIEEHKYVKLADKAVQRSGAGMDIGGMYSRLIKGFNGYPKMSKSIPESNIDGEMPDQEVMDKIMNPGDEFDSPEDSVVYQMMSLVSDYDPERLDHLYELCNEGGEDWNNAKEEYAEDLITILKKW